MTTQPVKAWICPVCGYIHYGDQPPETCPVCGEDGSVFTPYEEPTKPAASLINENLNIVIIGGGIAGVSAIEAIRSLSKTVPITLISDEPGLPYYRINLTRYLAGEVAAGDMALHDQVWYTNNTIHLIHGKVTGFDTYLQQITLEDGQTLNYDRLILAAGAFPFLPPIEGRKKRNIVTLRTLADADASCPRQTRKRWLPGRRYSWTGDRCAIARSGATITVLEACPAEAAPTESKSSAVFEKDRQTWNRVRTNVKTKAFAGEEAVTAVVLEDGTDLPADLVVVSAGVRPRIDLAREAGLKVNQGIVVNDAMQTSYENIFAAGDIAEHHGVLYGTWTPAQLQGSIAGMSALGQTASFPGVPRSNKVKVLGFDLMSIGTVNPELPEDRLVDAEVGENYYSFITRGEKLVGCILMGNASLAAQAKTWIEEGKQSEVFGARQLTIEQILKLLEI